MSNSARRIIPPLPGSMFTSNSVSDKENIPNNRIKLQGHRPLDKSRPVNTSANVNDSVSSISDTTDHSGNTLNSSFSSQHPRQRQASSISYLKENSMMNTSFQSFNRVLRSGETLENLFCITENCHNTHRRLCESIVNNIEGSANDLAKWRKALDLACDTVESSKEQTNKSEGMSTLLFYTFHGSSNLIYLSMILHI